MKTQKTRKPGPVIQILCWFFAVWMALPASMVGQVVTLNPPTFPSSNTVRISVATGPVTNIRYNVYWTNSLTNNALSWPLLATGAANQVIFDLALPDTNQGFFLVSSNHIATTNPPPKVATPVFTPPSTNGNASVLVRVTCDTPGAVIYYTTDGNPPTTSDNYIANNGTILIQCMTTLKARAFRTSFIDSDVATGAFNVNCPPVVSAGGQQTTSGSSVTLAGSSSDDGLTQALSNYWRQASGPGTVTFGDRNSLTSTAGLPIDGIYVLQLEAYDGYWTSTSRVTVARNPKISIAITRPTDSSTFNVPTNIALEASTNGSSVTVTQVQFFAGSQLIGTATTPTTNSKAWTFDWRNVPAGNQSLTAVATSSDTSHFALASGPVSITVNFPTDIGRFTFAANDLTIPAAGLPIAINRIHDSRFGSGNLIGYNARLDFEAIKIEKSTTLGVGYSAQAPSSHCIQPEANRALITISLSSTEQYYFRPRVVFQGGTDGVPCVGPGSTTYASPLRYVFDTVGVLGGKLASFNVPGSEEVGMVGEEYYDLGQWTGEIYPGYYDFDGEPLGSYEPEWTLFTFTAPDGTQYKFDANGKLAQRIDRNNNSLTYTFESSSGSISNSTTKHVQLTIASGRITEIKDPVGIAGSGPAAIKYGYDGSGHMTNVARLIDRAGSGTYENTGYFYDDGSYPHLITRVIDPRGITTISNSYDAFGRLTYQHDALGNYTSFTYEDNGRRQIITDRNGRSTRHDLTETGQVESTQDAEGAVTSYSYDANGRRVAEITPLGATNSFAYNERDELISATNELGFTQSVTYNSFGLPLTVVDAMSLGATNGYDSKGNLIATTNALGIVSRYGYDAQGNRTAETNAFGLTEQTVKLSQYDQFGYLTNVTDALGRVTGYTADGNGNRLTERRQRTLASGSTQALWTTNVYDAVSRAIAVIEPDGFTNRTVYNGIGKVAFTTNKLGIVTRFDYDAREFLTNTIFALGTAQQASEQNGYDAEGRKTNSINRAGQPTGYQYDAVGLLRRTTNPDGTYTEHQYDAGGRLFATLQGSRPPGGPVLPLPSLTTRFEYDAAHRRIATINALSQTNRYAYDANGNQTNFVDALKRTNSYTFDRLNRQTRIRFSDGTTESYRYDGLDRRVAVTNQASIVAGFGFDALGRLTAATNAIGLGTSNWVTYAYDEVGNQTNQVDALGRRTRFEYDSMARLVRTAQPGAQAELFAYNAVGDQVRHTNFNGVILTNQYDALNRLTNKSSGGGYSAVFTYTPTGKRATMTDASGSYVYAYDTNDRIGTNGGPAGTISYGYDLFGRLASIQTSHSGGASVTYNYDDLNRLSNAVDSVAGTTDYGYDNVGNLQTVRYPNAVTNTYTYNALNRLTNLTTKAASGTLASFVYKLAAAGNRTNLSETVNSESRTFAWYYDAQYRLTNETITGTAPTGTISYRHDAVGNRTNRTSSVTGIATASSSYNTNDWLTTDVYDSNGNTRTNGATPYFYDAENRLTNFNNAAATFVYNADGIRVRKTVGATDTLYLVDDQNPTGYAQVLEELTVSGGTTNLAKVYTYGLDLIAQRDPSSGLRTFYGYDGNGNTRYLTTTNASVSDTYVYDAFGTVIANTGTTENSYRYTGEQFDSDLGFYYLRARYLNTGTGRFWTRDPFRGHIREPQTLNRYLYTVNDPANRTDPNGLDTGSAAGAVGGLSVGGILQGLPTLVISKSFVKALVVSAAIAGTLGGDASKNQNNTMRLQLQAGNDHYWSQVLGAPQNTGVSSAQVRGGLAAMHAAVIADLTLLPFPGSAEPQLFSAIIRMSQKLTPIVAGGGVTQGGNVLREIFFSGTEEFRIDLENLRGHNLKR